VVIAVAKGAKHGGRDFKPGNPGGPGRPPLPPELKDVRRLTKTEFERIVNRFLWLSDAEFEKALRDPALSKMERVIANIVAKAAEHGDHTRAEWLAMRLLGKVQDKVEVSQPKPFVVNRLDGGQLVLGSKAEEKDE
jgi:hypothetical protein